MIIIHMNKIALTHMSIVRAHGLNFGLSDSHGFIIKCKVNLNMHLYFNIFVAHLLGKKSAVYSCHQNKPQTSFKSINKMSYQLLFE